MPNWEDEFDLDQLEAKPAAKKQKEKKMGKKKEEDFFDLEDDTSAKAGKLPAIGRKPLEVDNSNTLKEKVAKKSKNVYDDYEELYESVQEVKSPPKVILKNAVDESSYYEQLEQLNEVKPKTSKKGNAKVAQKIGDDEEFYESVEEIKPPVREVRKVEQNSLLKNVTSNTHKVQKEQQSQNYQQNFDAYKQDFQVEEKTPPKKSQTSANLKTKDNNIKNSQEKIEEKKYGINAHQMFTNKEAKNIKVVQPAIPKPPQKLKIEESKAVSKKTIEAKHSLPTHGLSQPPKKMEKSSSKQSLKSNDSRSNIGHSRASKKQVTQFVSNRHVLLVEKTFPEDEQKLNVMNIDRLTRANEQMRDMIRKFNEQLNELINKNMIMMKQKPVQKQKNINEKVKMLEEQLRSGATALEVIENQSDRLKGREGELREEEYQLIMEKRIEEAQQQIKQKSKIIIKLKYEINSDGNRLSKHQIQNKIAQELHQIKVMLIQTKKQEEKNESRLQKLDKMMEQLEGKHNDKEYELTEQMDSAKEKGIVINVKDEHRKKYDELKMKIATGENHHKCLFGLHKNKCDLIGHQSDQIKNNIRGVESQINNICQSVDHSMDESVKIIKKAKDNPKISPIMFESLDKLLKSLQESQNTHYYDVRSEGNKSQASDRPLKVSMYQNINKEKSIRNSSSKHESSMPKLKPETHNDDLNLMKPNFMKKKEKPTEAVEKQEEKTNILYEGVWNEEEEERKKQQKKQHQEQKKKQQQKKKEVLGVEQDKKKPFTLKKNRMNNQQKSFELTPETTKTQQLNIQKNQIMPAAPEIKKEEDKPIIGPKFTRMSKKQANENKIEIPSQKSQEVKDIKKVVQSHPQEHANPQKEEQQAIFVPKRFNLRNKLEKKEDSYIPTIESKKQEKKEEVKQYTPNFSFKEQTYTTPIVEPRKIQNDIKAEEEKPKFTLRLKDRQKKQAEDTEYVPTKITEIAEDKLQKDKIEDYRPSLIEPSKEKQNFNSAKNQQSYIPIFKQAEKDYNTSNPVTSKLQTIPPKQGPNQFLPKEPTNNPYAPKQVSVPVVQQQKSPINNPYVQKEDGPKREREGPVKKAKVQNKGPKQKFNIYEQADDIIEPLSQPVGTSSNEPVNQKPQNVDLVKTDQLDLNALLGIKKKQKATDLDELLGEIKVDKKIDRKKNNDFFNDLQI